MLLHILSICKNVKKKIINKYVYKEYILYKEKNKNLKSFGFCCFLNKISLEKWVYIRIHAYIKTHTKLYNTLLHKSKILYI